MKRLLWLTTLLSIFVAFPLTQLRADELPAVRLLISNPAPYIGEEVIVTLEIRTLPRPQGQIFTIWPNLDSCASAELQTPPPRLEESGRPVLVQLIQRTIRPLHSGRLPLISAGVSIGGTVYYAPPVELRVLPLPLDGRPDNFAGAVGQIKMHLESDGKGTREIRLILEGHASLETFPSPTAELPAEERLILIDDTTTGVAPQIRTRTLRYLYMPGENDQGRLSFSLPVYDPVSQSYVIHSAGIRLLPLWFLRLLYLLAGLAVIAHLIRTYRKRRTPRTVEEALNQILGLPQQQVCRDEILHFLRSNGAPPSLLSNLALHWQVRDRLQYAPAKLRLSELQPSDIERSRELLLQLIRMKSLIRWIIIAVERAVTDQLRARITKLSM